MELWQAHESDDGSVVGVLGRADHVGEPVERRVPSALRPVGQRPLVSRGHHQGAELEAGHIDHVIAVNVVETTAGVEVPPANRNDGKSSSAIVIPEGTRFRLDPRIDVTKLDLSPVAVTVAARDSSGTGWSSRTPPAPSC